MTEEQANSVRGGTSPHSRLEPIFRNGKWILDARVLKDEFHSSKWEELASFPQEDAPPYEPIETDE